MNKTRIFVGSCFLSIASLALAQDQPAAAQAPAPAPAAAPAPVWSVGPIDFSGLIDGYYTANFNHPMNSDGTPGQNGLNNFNVMANQFSLSMAKLTMSHDADPIGFRVDLGFGHAFDIIHGSEPAGPSFLRNIEQAYVSLKNKKGIELDAGQFVTSAGAEVIEAKDNWNYSRSLLFAWAIPYYHFGIRTIVPVGSHFTGGVQVINGWNNLEDNNTGKTLGFTGNISSKKATWSNTYYTGPENKGTNKGWRNLYDTTLLLTPMDKFNAYFNFDYGKNNNADGKTSATWKGVAGAAKFQLNDKFAITPRLEWFSDADGFNTGTKQDVKEFTITAEAKAAQGVLARLEYRYDWSDKPFFQSGATGISDHQSTLSLGLIAFFGPKH